MGKLPNAVTVDDYGTATKKDYAMALLAAHEHIRRVESELEELRSDVELTAKNMDDHASKYAYESGDFLSDFADDLIGDLKASRERLP